MIVSLIGFNSIPLSLTNLLQVFLLSKSTLWGLQRRENHDVLTFVILMFQQQNQTMKKQTDS